MQDTRPPRRSPLLPLFGMTVMLTLALLVVFQAAREITNAG